MRITIGQSDWRSSARDAFTIVEVVFAMATAAFMFLALYSGLTGGFTIMRLARENTRATQILVEKMETIRLYSWEQITSNSFIPTNFSVPYYPMGGSNAGTIYHGTVTLGDALVGASYQNDMKKVSIRLDWQTGQLPRTRTISTYVSRYGLQNYVYF
jgi:hypothetical protein